MFLIQEFLTIPFFLTIGKQLLERPALSEISKYIPPSGAPRHSNNTQSQYSSYPECATTNQSNISPYVPMPKANNHLIQFIEKQEGYIEQLERESQFCRVSQIFKIIIIINIQYT